MDWMFEDMIDGKLESALCRLEENRVHIREWRENGAVLYEYVKLMRAIQSNPERQATAHLNRIQKVKQGIDKMLDVLNDACAYVDEECEIDDEEMKKRVCLMTMQKKLDMCIVHLSLEK